MLKQQPSVTTAKELDKYFVALVVEMEVCLCHHLVIQHVLLVAEEGVFLALRVVVQAILQYQHLIQHLIQFLVQLLVLMIAVHQQSALDVMVQVTAELVKEREE